MFGKLTKNAIFQKRAQCVVMKCRTALWLLAREALWSNCKQTQSSELRIFVCEKFELLLRSRRGNRAKLVVASSVGSHYCGVGTLNQPRWSNQTPGQLLSGHGRKWERREKARPNDHQEKQSNDQVWQEEGGCAELEGEAIGIGGTQAEYTGNTGGTVEFQSHWVHCRSGVTVRPQVAKRWKCNISSVEKLSEHSPARPSTLLRRFCVDYWLIDRFWWLSTKSVRV